MYDTNPKMKNIRMDENLKILSCTKERELPNNEEIADGIRHMSISLISLRVEYCKVMCTCSRRTDQKADPAMILKEFSTCRKPVHAL